MKVSDVNQNVNKVRKLVVFWSILIWDYFVKYQIYIAEINGYGIKRVRRLNSASLADTRFKKALF